MIAAVVRVGLLLVWLGLHASAALAFAGRWWATFWLILATPVYVWVVHQLDRLLTLGGVGSGPASSNAQSPLAPSTGASARSSSAIANQTVAIATGFAAILLFNAVRFQTDLHYTGKSTPQSEAVLSVAAVAFCLACILNLLQLLVRRLVDRQEIGDTVRRRLRRRVRLFNSLEWHSLITPVILLLLLLGSPLPALSINAFYGSCLYAYYFTRMGGSRTTQPSKITSERMAIE